MKFMAYLRNRWDSFQQKRDEEFQRYLDKVTLKEVEPCPFCGERTIRIFEYDGFLGRLPIYRSMCVSCGASSGNSLTFESSKQKWNERK